MPATQGMQPLGVYATNDSTAVNTLLALIPDPDSSNSSGATAGGSLLDQMSPGCAAQLRVELIALRTAIQTTNTL